MRWFARVGGELYFIAQDNALYGVNGSTSLYEGDEDAMEQTEGPVSWYGETGDMGMDTPDNQYLAALQLCLELEAGSTFTVKLRYDGGDWVQAAKITAATKRFFNLPIIPRRCGLLRLRLEGQGDGRLYSIAKVTESATELP